MRASNMFIRCPHCENKATVRTSQQLTKLLRSLICQCSNPLCGHTFNAHLEAVSTLSPSAVPDQDVYLPISAHAKSRISSQRSMAEDGVAGGIGFRPKTTVGKTIEFPLTSNHPANQI